MGCELFKALYTDIKRTELIPTKAVYFLYAAGISSVMPFQPLFFKSLGLTIEEIAVVSSIQPFLCFLAPPIVGILSDKLGHTKGLFIILLMATVMVNGSFPLLPPVRVVDEYNSQLHWSQQANDSTTVWISGFTERCHLRNLSQVGARFQGVPLGCLSKTNSSANDTEEWEISSPLGNKAPSVVTVLSPVALRLAPLENLPLNQTTYFEHNHNVIVFDATWILNSSACGGVVNGSDVCSAVVHYKPGSMWLLLGLFLLVCTLIRVTTSLLKATALIIVQAAKTEFGFQACWSLLGTSLLPPLTGILADLATEADGEPDFRVAFCLAMVFGTATASVATCLPIKQHAPTHDMAKNLKHLVCSSVFGCILVIQFWTGAFEGYISRYLLLYLDEFHLPATAMGIVVTTGSISGLIFYLLSGSILRKFNHSTVVMVASCLLVIRLLGYSYMQNPYMAIPLQALEGITHHLVDVCILTFMSAVTPPDVFMSAQGLLQGIREGPGKGIGILAGGLLTSYLSARLTFRIMGVVASGVAVFYAIAYCCCLRQPFAEDEYQIIDVYLDKSVESSTEKTPLLKKHKEPQEIIAS